MKINNWKIFNESVSEDEFDKKMATEIIYYFEESSQPTQEFVDIFYGIFGTKFTYYDTSYDEMIEFTEKLMSICEKDEQIKSEMISLYKKIREEREDFPTFWEIEECVDMFMDKTDFYLFVKSNSTNYEIKVGFIEKISIDEFCKWCKYCETVVKKLRGPNHKTIIDSCEYADSGYQKFVIALSK